MYKGIDCASRVTQTAAKTLRYLGYDFVGRYLVPQKSYNKALTNAEAEMLVKSGLRILSVWETTADRAKGGASAGVSDGKRALTCAEELEMPVNSVIYFAVDFDAQKSDYLAIEAYLQAAKGMLLNKYRIGVYGSYGVVEAMAEREVCDAYWQCVAWSHGKRSGNAATYQAEWSGTAQAKALEAQLGFPVDINECSDMDAAGIWPMPVQEVELPGDCIGHWAQENIRWAIGMGLMRGYTDGSFRPDNFVSRAEAATLLRRLHELENFRKE